MNPPADDIRAQIRMYGRQSTYTSGYTGSSDPQSAIASTYGISSLESMRRSAMDRYTPRLHETNYSTAPYNVPDNRRDITPHPMGFGSRQHYPYPHPGSSGGWPG
ncbi:hypothetical protein PR202_ga31139 [Eleusine coracana subsp. coracana]|uniref:Uncharacterized protein n=1 Tax=Eleusine coracana subsp. coracana TaxID=191504 RepID=A0AAV5DRJ3_ELECO|nr:hypothetical protein PR202_ga31139 [Eleusine coracana subsp. coracana]